MSHRSLGVGAYRADEKHLVITANGYRAGGPLVLVGHGGGDDAWVYSPPAFRRDLDYLASLGFVVVAVDFAGLAWCNDDFLEAVDDAIAWAVERWAADVRRISWIGDSMNGAGALNWCWRNPTRVGGVVLRVPGVALQHVYDRSSVLADDMDDAYDGSGGWAANAADRDPMANTARIVPIAGRCRIYYSSNDPLVPYSEDIAPFVAATGMQAVSLGARSHDTAQIYPAIDAAAQARWLLAHAQDRT